MATDDAFPLLIHLFGPFEACLQESPLPRLRSRKGQWLLALLVLRHGREVERAWLAGTLWPDSSEAAAFVSLRISLKDLRHALGPEASRLRSPAPRTLFLDLKGAHADVVAFDQAIARGGETALERAIELYRGPLLEGCVEEWAFQERQVREQAYLTALETLAAQAMERADTGTAERHLRRAIALEPLRETSQRGLMQALAAGGSYGAAIEVYRELRLRLHRELNAAPDPETQTLYQQIRAEARSKMAGATERPPVPPFSVAPSSVSPPAPVARSPHPGLPSDFSPLRSLPTFTHNLPLEWTSFIGREKEIAEAKQLLSTTPLLTLTGPGGCGKTRLALQTAVDVLKTYPDGVWLVELASLSEPTLVPHRVASALGVPEQPGCPLTVTLIEHLRSRSLLLVLDNCEHLLEACVQLIDSLLRACPYLRILVTSREQLGLTGERVYLVPSLSLPEQLSLTASGAKRMGVAMQSEAVRLFVERAVYNQPQFALTEQNAGAVAQLCQRLDGIPLALELAAARVKALPVEQLVARMDDAFRLLTGGSRTALPRQQTLRALIDWSYDLLSEAEKTVLCRLSVFAGGWILEAAEAVCAGPGDQPRTARPRPRSGSCIQEWEVLDLLASLVDKSLVIYEERGGEGRYRLLETVRQYAREQLVDRGEAATVSARHRDWFLALAERAEPELRRSDQLVWLDRLEVEHDNLRLALEWCRSEADGAEAELRLASALVWFWARRGHLSEGKQCLEGALSRGGDAPARLRIPVLQGVGHLASLSHSDPAAAVRFYQAGLDLARETGDPDGMARACAGLALQAALARDSEQASALAEEGLVRARAVGDPWLIAHCVHLLGYVARGQGDGERATSLFQDSLALMRQVGDKWNMVFGLLNLGGVAQARNDYAAARCAYQEGLALSHELRDRRGMAWLLECLAEVAVAQDRPEHGARLMGAAEGLLDTIGAGWPPNYVASRERTGAAIGVALGEAAFTAARAEGRAMPLEQAIRVALEVEAGG